ncbi:MAG TPA: four helix bundle protein [Bacteroidia bacterium]|jgi:four helix bundle protein|nr:four helix bundle protein [Bacteroidia bacterium]
MRHNFKNLVVWQKAMDLTDIIYSYNKGLPASERFNLIDQLNRSSCSIPANIAEGSGKRSKLQFAEFLSIALTSSYELETQLLICQRRKYGTNEKLVHALSLTGEVQKMIFTFREKIINEQ